jgi:hypothetical protein
MVNCHDIGLFFLCQTEADIEDGAANILKPLGRKSASRGAAVVAGPTAPTIKGSRAAQQPLPQTRVRIEAGEEGVSSQSVPGLQPPICSSPSRAVRHRTGTRHRRMSWIKSLCRCVSVFAMIRASLFLEVARVIFKISAASLRLRPEISSLSNLLSEGVRP